MVLNPPLLLCEPLSVIKKMMQKDLNNLTLFDFSMNWDQINFDSRSLNKPISELSLEDYNWCLRNRLFLNQIIDLTIYQIENNLDKIDKYYPSEVCQWFDEAIIEIITIPFEFWESRISAFQKIQEFIKSYTIRELKIEKQMLNLFLNHTPKPKAWTLKDSKNFIENIAYAEGLDLAGNLIESFNAIKNVKYAIMYDQAVYIEPAYVSISDVNELYKFIREEYSDLGDIIEDHIIAPLIKEEIITVANKA